MREKRLRDRQTEIETERQMNGKTNKQKRLTPSSGTR